MPNNKSLVDELSRIPDTVDARIKAAVSEILSLAEKYRRSGYSFTFSGTDIDADVNRILVQLSDYILEDADSEAYALTSDEDRDDALAYVNSLYDYQENVDKYSSHLKLILEGWLAIGFANSVSKGNLMSSIFSYMDNPYISPSVAKGLQGGTEIRS